MALNALASDLAEATGDERRDYPSYHEAIYVAARAYCDEYEDA